MATLPKKLSREQLARMTREEKITYLEAFKEKERRLKEQRSIFVPHEGQMAIVTHPSKIRVVTAGNGSGKTAVASNIAKWGVEGFNPVTEEYTAVPSRVYVILDDPSKVEEVWLVELRKWMNIGEEQLKKNGKPYYTEITFPNGSFIKFLFHGQEDLRVESLEGDLFIFDEPPPRRMWIGLLRGGRTKGRPARYVIIGTPISQAWLRDYFKSWKNGEFPDTEFFSMHTESNRANLADGYIEGFSSHLTERERRTRLEGEFFNTDGLALADLFSREIHITDGRDFPEDWKQKWPAVLAVDPHPNKPTVASILVAAPNGRLYYVAEREAKEIPRVWAQWVKANWLHEYRIVDMVCDSAGNTDFTGGEGFKSFIEVWNSEGLRIRGTTYDEKKDDDFLERLQEGLYVPEKGEPALRFLRGCSPGVVEDIENVGWQPIKGTESYKPKLAIENTDFLATLKYALATNLSFEGAKKRNLRPLGASTDPEAVFNRATKGFEQRKAGFKPTRPSWRQNARNPRKIDPGDDW